MKEENSKKDDKAGKNTLKTKVIKTIRSIATTKAIRWLLDYFLGIPTDWKGD